MESKQLLRKKYTKLRSIVLISTKKKAERSIAAKLLASEWYQKADTILVYAAYGSEVSVNLIVLQALQDRKTVCFPRCVNGEEGLEFCVVTDPNTLKRGMYGIREPEMNLPKVLTFSENSICLVPALAYDKNGYRLGHGKGYYDRFLSRYPGIKIGVCMEKLLLDTQQWEYDRYDVAVDQILTEHEIYPI